jgi:hypothetical protein
MLYHRLAAQPVEIMSDKPSFDLLLSSPGHDTMMFGLGDLSGRYGRGALQPALPSENHYTKEESDNVMRTITDAVHGSEKVLRWRWSSGDLIIVDNLAVAHLAAGGTQDEKAGLRLMRRTTVKGVNVPSKRPFLHGLPHECVFEHDIDNNPGFYCLFSLKDFVSTAKAQSKLEHPDEDHKRFDSRELADRTCKILSPDASLAMPVTSARNSAAQRVVSAVGCPHWLGADDEPNGHVTWSDPVFKDRKQGLPEDIGPWENFETAPGWPWHADSGQPNDCDGPGTETCIFMGPNGKWFDFACAAKVPDLEKGRTPGPEITWEDGSRREYDIFPLCGLYIKGTGASQIGLRAYGP